MCGRSSELLDGRLALQVQPHRDLHPAGEVESGLYGNSCVMTIKQFSIEQIGVYLIAIRYSDTRRMVSGESLGLYRVRSTFIGWRLLATWVAGLAGIFLLRALMRKGWRRTPLGGKSGSGGVPGF